MFSLITYSVYMNPAVPINDFFNITNKENSYLIKRMGSTNYFSKIKRQLKID